MQREDLLVSTDWLNAHLHDPKVRVVDVRWGLDGDDLGEQEYGKGHIPGAVYLHWLRDLSDPGDPVTGQLAPPDRFRQMMEQSGISDDTMVVAYDDNIIFMAARMVWMLHYYGHRQVRILDGGLPKWQAEGRPVDALSPAPAPGHFTPQPHPALRTTRDDVLGLIEKRDRLLLDCRMDKTWHETGAHIPGAGRMPAPGVLNADGTWKDNAALSVMALAAGARADQPVVLYCGGGISAACSYVALSLLGFSQLTVYDGSWNEWGKDPSLPQERH